MRKRLHAYINEMDAILRDTRGRNLQKVLEEHLIQIRFFQHERLVHLIVTGTVAIIAMLAFWIFVLTQALYIRLVLVLLLILFVSYIIHYFMLENGVQRLYQQYDELLQKMADAPSYST